MPSETRYFRSDTQTVNGLTAYKLGTEQSATAESKGIGSGYPAQGAYVGIRVWKRSNAGVETEITAGTPVAVASKGSLTTAIVSATWDCPQTSLDTTDAIVVRVYGRWGTGAWNLLAEFITEQLGATILNAVTWTVYYSISYRRYVDPDTGEITYTAGWNFGTTTYNSRIENFTWTSAAPPAVAKKTMGDGLTWIMS
jgi:hypothetical protein